MVACETMTGVPAVRVKSRQALSNNRRGKRKEEKYKKRKEERGGNEPYLGSMTITQTKEPVMQQVVANSTAAGFRALSRVGLEIRLTMREIDKRKGQ